MRDIFGLFGDDDNRDDRTKDSEEATLRLRKEELDVDKNRVHTGDVTLSKDIVEEHKTVDVPVNHEEVVIERRDINNEPSDSPITSSDETIRIPVSEEHVDVDKHTVVTGEVSAYKRDIEETKHIDETLKKEKAHINTEGNPDVVSDETIHDLH